MTSNKGITSITEGQASAQSAKRVGRQKIPKSKTPNPKETQRASAVRVAPGLKVLTFNFFGVWPLAFGICARPL
jgi:hypothetical protein